MPHWRCCLAGIRSEAGEERLLRAAELEGVLHRLQLAVVLKVGCVVRGLQAFKSIRSKAGDGGGLVVHGLRACVCAV